VPEEDGPVRVIEEVPVTRQRWFLNLTLLVGAGLLACLTSAAAEKAAEPEVPPADPGTDPVSRIALASRLIEYGRATHSPASLIEGARILRSIPGEKLKKEKPTTLNEKGEKVESAGAPDETPNLVEQAEAVLKEAKALAAERAKLTGPEKLSEKQSALLTSLADLLLAEKLTRGSQGGPKLIQNNLRAGQSDVWNLKFDREQMARISVRSHGGHLWLAVRNPENIIRATDAGPCPRVAFVPHRRDGTDFRVIVTNKGDRTVWYQLFTN
jgi:hypothetical protein